MGCSVMAPVALVQTLSFGSGFSLPPPPVVGFFPPLNEVRFFAVILVFSPERSSRHQFQIPILLHTPSKFSEKFSNLILTI